MMQMIWELKINLQINVHNSNQQNRKEKEDKSNCLKSQQRPDDMT